MGQSLDILAKWAMNESTMGHVLVIRGSTVVGHIWVIYVIWVNHGIYGSHESQSYGSTMGHIWVIWVIHGSTMNHI